MIYTNETLKNVKNATDVKYALNSDSYFFTRKTMKFFGDRMNSFGVRTVNGKRYMYRKPTARVNVFGTWKTAGKTFFNAWEITPHTDHVKLNLISDEVKEQIYNAI